MIDSAESGDVVAFFIPTSHLDELLHSEDMTSGGEFARFMLANDAILQHSIRALLECRPATDDMACRADEAARRLVLRLVELACGRTPEWHTDAGVFDKRSLLGFVEFVDENLRWAPSLSDMAQRAGLSPSHFAKKFRQTTGLSLHRFINRRRILRSLDMLRDQSRPLAVLALELGFSSQSHFTRLFSGLTGMTPARYQKQLRQAVG